MTSDDGREKPSLPATSPHWITALWNLREVIYWIAVILVTVPFARWGLLAILSAAGISVALIRWTHGRDDGPPSIR